LANTKRDKFVNYTLRRLGWRVLRIWEHALARKRQWLLVRRIQKALKN